MGSIVLVTGGAKSGKSLFAERLVAALGENVVYVATAEIYDSEMHERIARHRARRPTSWTTVEAPRDLGPAIAQVPASVEAVLVDCLTIWTANRMLALGDIDGESVPSAWSAKLALLERSLHEELDELLATAHQAPWHLVLVTNEVGYGVVPATPLGRVFRDVLGAVGQHVAQLSDAVYLVVGGIAIEVKSRSVSPADAATRLIQELS